MILNLPDSTTGQKNSAQKRYLSRFSPLIIEDELMTQQVIITSLSGLRVAFSADLPKAQIRHWLEALAWDRLRRFIWLRTSPTYESPLMGYLWLFDVPERDPFSEAWFIFYNRYRDKINILFWDLNGFWFYYRRLEKGHFTWAKPTKAGAIHITKQQLHFLLAGLKIDNPHAHPPRQAHFKALNLIGWF